MIITHIISSFTGGGAERFVVSLCNQLSKKDSLKVHIISLFDVSESMFLHEQVSQRVKIHTLNKKLGFDYSVFFSLNKLIKKINPDIVHTHLRAFNYNYLNLIFNKNPKYFHTLHSDAILECPSSKNRTLRKVFLKKNVIPITISEESSISFRKHYKLNNDLMIYNGREEVKATENYSSVLKEINNYKKNTDTKVFLHIGNLLPVKNQNSLLKAFKQFGDNGANAILLLIGDRRPGDTEIYKNMESYLGENIKYLGVKTNVEDYLLNSDVFVLVSHIEGMPMTLIEALSAKCIPIVTPVGGMINMVNHLEHGILSESPDANDIYTAFELYGALSKERIKEIKLRIIKSYQNDFSITKSSEAYLKAYKS